MSGTYREVIKQLMKPTGKQVAVPNRPGTSLLDPSVSPGGIPVRPVKDVQGTHRFLDDPLLPPPVVPPRPPYNGPVPTGGVPGKLLKAGAGLGAVGAGIYGISRLDSDGNPVPLVDDTERVKQDIAAQQGKTVQQVEQEARDVVKSQLPEEDVGWFDKLNEGFDMATFGMHLLANNDGNQNIGQAIGKALAAARQYSSTQGRLAEEDAITERKVKAIETSAEAEAKRAEASMITALNSRTSAILGQTDTDPPNSTELTNAQVSLSAVLGNPINMDKPASAAVVNNLAKLIKERNNELVLAGQPKMNSTDEQGFINFFIKNNEDLFKPDFFNTGPAEYTIKPDAVMQARRAQQSP